MQGPMRPRVCLGVKQTLTNGGKCKGWSPKTPKCIPILGVVAVRELWMSRASVEMVNKPQIGPPKTPFKKVLKHRCLKCPYIIQTWFAWIMIKRTSESQIGNLIPDHKSLESKGQMTFDWGMLYTIGKIFLGAIKFEAWFEKDVSGQSFGTTKVLVLGLPFRSFEEKWHLHVIPIERHKIYYREGSDASSQRLWAMKSLCMRLFQLSPSHHLHSTCTNYPLLLVV